MLIKKKDNAQIIKKICAILLLIALFLNTNFFTIALLTVDALASQNSAEIEKISMNLSYNQLTNKVQNEVVITGVLETDTKDSKLFENPTIYFELPAEVEKVIINDIKILYDEELTLGEYKVETNENGNQQIKVALTGKQTKHQTDGIVKGTNIRIVANIMLKQEIKSADTNIIMKCGEAKYEEKIKVVNSTDIKALEKIDDMEGNKTYAQGLLVETKVIRGDSLLNNEDIIYEKEIIKYEIKITNTTEQKIDDIKIITNIPEHMGYVPYKPGEQGYGFYSDTDTKQHEIKVESIEPEETQEYYFELQASDDLDTRDLKDKVMSEYEEVVAEKVMGAEGYDQMTEEEKWELRKKVIRDITIEIEPNIIEEEITEIIDYVIDKVYTQNAGEIVDTDVNPNYIEKVEVQINVLIKDEIICTYKIAHSLKINEINAILTSVASGAVRNNWNLFLTLYRINEHEETEENYINATVSIRLPEILKIEKVLSLNDDGKELEFEETEDGVLVIKVENIDEIYQLELVAKAINSIEDIDNYSYKIRLAANVTVDSGIVYKSNETIIEGSREAVKITQTSDKNGEKLESLDELTYIFTIENIGKAPESHGGYTKIIFEDYIPNSLKIEEVEYNDNDVRIQIIDGVAVNVVTPVTRTWNGIQLKDANDKDSEKEPRIKLNLNIRNDETITLKIKTSVKLIEEEEYNEIIENYATISGEEIKTRQSNIITNVIYKESGEKDVVVTPDNPDKPTQPTNPTIPVQPEEPEIEEFTLSGMVWLDENENGKLDEEEGGEKGLTVYLYNVETNQFFENENGKLITKKTDKNGKYLFENVPQGKYYVIIEIDTEKYTITDYQKNDVSELTNCDFIQKEVKLPEGQKIVGITDTVDLIKDTENIDLGLVKIKVFDLKIEQFVQKITVTNKKGTKEYNYNNEKFAKIEIHSKQFVGSTVVIEYKIRITNVGEMAGYANEIIAEIPQQFDFHSELNTDWNKSMSYNLSNVSYRTKEIQPGESIEATLILSKTLDDDSAGTFTNITKIGISENVKHIEDKNKENDVDSTQVIIGVSTGTQTIVGITCIIIGIIIILFILYKILNKNNKKIFIFIIMMLMIISFNENVNAASYNGQYASADHNFSLPGATGATNEPLSPDQYTPEFINQLHQLDNQGFISGATKPCPGGHSVSSSGSSSQPWNEYQDFINTDGTPKGDISITASLTITSQSTFIAHVTVNDETQAPGDTVITVSCTGGGGSGVVPAGGGSVSINCSGAEFILGATIEAVKTCETFYTEVTQMTTSFDWVPAVHYDDDHSPSPYPCTASNPVLCHCRDVERSETETVTNEDGSTSTTTHYWTDHSADHYRYVFAALGLGSVGSSTSTVRVDIPITYIWDDSLSFGPENFPKKIYLNKRDWDTGNILPGAVFEIDGRTVATGEKIDMIFVGNHTLTEIETPFGYNYEKGNTYQVEINPNDTLVTVSATNKKNTGNLLFKLIDMVTKQPLAGVVVDVMGLLPEDKHGQNGVVRYTTDENGEIRVYDLLLDEDTEERTFYIKEIYNPANGYVVDDTDYGIVIDNEGNSQNAINHPEYGVVYPVLVKRQESTETGKILLEATEKSSGGKIEGLPFEVVGLMRKDSSQTIGGKTYTTEVSTDKVTYTTNDNGQIIIPDFLYTQDVTVYAKKMNDLDIEVVDNDGNVIEPIEHEIYGEVYPIVIKATDPNEEQKGSNKFQENIYTIENEMKYAKVSGTVWEDGEYDARNNQKDENETVIPKIKVKLYDPINQVIHVTWTDENGNYVFGIRTDKTYEFGTMPGSDDANYKDTHVLLRRASEYYVEFEYNGVKYRNVTLNADPTVYNVSKASEEIASKTTNEDATERIEFNERFTKIDAKEKINENGETTGTVINKEGEEYPDEISYQKSEDYKSEIVYGKNIQSIEGNPESYGEDIYHITATTLNNYDFKTYYDPVLNTTGYTEEIKAVNIGLYLREIVDLEIESDLARIDLSVNGYHNIYKYATIIQPSDDDNLEERFKNIKDSHYQRMVHSSTIVYSENNGTTNENGNVYADITYKIFLENKSVNLKAIINEITINYNTELECISYNYEGENPIAIQQDGTEINSTMKELILDVRALGNKVINNQSHNVLEVTFRAQANVLAEMLQDDVVLKIDETEYHGIKFDFMAEIKSYSTYSNNEEDLLERDENTLYEYASIDVDSAPRNAQVEIDEQNRFITDTFEDDTTIAPTIVFTTGSQTSLSGTVFLDSPELDKIIENERLGNGIFDDTESVMSNVKVELLLVPVDANEMYDSTMARDNITSKHTYERAKLYKTDETGKQVKIEDAVTYTDEKGNYTFEGVIADNYVIRYTYGENISGEGKSTLIYNNGQQVKQEPIKAREYKSTIITSDYIRKAINTSTDGIPHLNGDWTEGDTEKTWFLNEYLGTRYSDAVDDVEYRAYFEQLAKLNNENLDDSTKYAYSEMEAYTPYIKLGVEQFNDQNVAPTLTTQEDGTIDYEYKLQNVDFGLIERPIVDLQVDKSVSNLNVTLANNQVLIDGNPNNSTEKLPYVRTGIDDFVPIEMDTELIGGAKLEQEYTISITNNSELDYPIYKITSDTDVANERNYYYYGEKGNNSVTVRVGTLVDYLTPDMSVDLDEMKRNGWNVIGIEDLTSHKTMESTGEKTYRLITPEVEEALIKGDYFLFTTDAFADENDSLVKIGETKSITYSASKLLASKDNLKFTNDVEILEYIGYSQNKNKAENVYDRSFDTTPGNLIPEKAKEDDEDSVRTVITPPTGVIISKMLYVLTAGIGLTVLMIGIIFIRRKVLNK